MIGYGASECGQSYEVRLAVVARTDMNVVLSLKPRGASL
jgi:hypothetical protein